MSADRRSPSPPTRLDRIARLVLPRLPDLGGPGTFLAPVVLVGIFSLLGAVGMDPMVEAAFRKERSPATRVMVCEPDNSQLLGSGITLLGALPDSDGDQLDGGACASKEFEDVLDGCDRDLRH